MNRQLQKHIVPTFLLILILSIWGFDNSSAAPIQDPGSWTPTRDKVLVSQGNLVNHNGSLALTNTTYTIYWQPNTYNYSPHYTQLINGFLINVAADNGKSSNVYTTTTQYGAPYVTAFGGSVVDTNPFPSNGCSISGVNVCLTDAQIQTEVSRVVSTKGWTNGLNKVYLLFTPAGVGSCFTSGLKCSYTDYCAYHSYIGDIGNPTLYANIPYPIWNSAKCDSYQHPNGDNAADAAINLVANEHLQTLSDPTRNGWFDSISYEQAEKCAWGFGTALGWNVYGKYNQVINGHQYYLQQQWSNRSSRCVLTGS